MTSENSEDKNAYIKVNNKNCSQRSVDGNKETLMRIGLEVILLHLAKNLSTCSVS